VRLLHDAADAGYPAAQARLGTLYAFGVGVQRSEARAVLFYTFAAMNGDVEANAILAHRFQHGIGVPASCTKAAKYAKAAADNVARTFSTQIQPVYDTTKIETTGREKQAQGNQADTVQVLMLQADQDSQQACMMLGYGYMYGRFGLKPDTHRAIEYFSKAARLGEAAAYGALGDVYSHGAPTAEPPVPRDLKLAKKLYAKGADLDHPVSLNGLGFLYAAGLIDENDEIAVDAPPPAAADAKKSLPSSSPSSAGDDDSSSGTSAPATSTAGAAPQPPKPNWKKAFDNFKKAADKGSAEGSYNLAVLHLNGRGTRRDVNVARGLFEVARKAGSVLSRYQLANMDLLGIGRDAGGCRAALRNFNEVIERGAWRSRQDKAKAHYDAGEPGAALLDYLILAEQGVPHALANAPVLIARELNANADGGAAGGMPFLTASGATHRNHQRMYGRPAEASGSSAVDLASSAVSTTGSDSSAPSSTAAAGTGSDAAAADDDEEDLDPRAVVQHALLWRAVHLGQRHAHVRLGDNYWYGRGTRRNRKRAEEHYQQAANAGSAEGHFNVALMYEEGSEHTRRDFHLAKRHFDAAAAADPHAAAAVNLALLRMNFRWWWSHFYGKDGAGVAGAAQQQQQQPQQSPRQQDAEPQPFGADDLEDAEDPDADAEGTLAMLRRVGRRVDAWIPEIFGVALDTMLLGGSFLIGLVLLHMRHHAV